MASAATAASNVTSARARLRTAHARVLCCLPRARDSMDRRLFVRLAVLVFTPTIAVLTAAAFIPRRFKQRPGTAIAADARAEAKGYAPLLVQLMAVRLARTHSSRAV